VLFCDISLVLLRVTLISALTKRFLVLCSILAKAAIYSILRFGNSQFSSNWLDFLFSRRFPTFLHWVILLFLLIQISKLLHLSLLSILLLVLLVTHISSTRYLNLMIDFSLFPFLIPLLVLVILVWLFLLVWWFQILIPSFSCSLSIFPFSLWILTLPYAWIPLGVSLQANGYLLKVILILTKSEKQKTKIILLKLTPYLAITGFKLQRFFCRFQQMLKDHGWLLCSILWSHWKHR